MISVIICALLLSSAYAAVDRGYSYDAQDQWPGVCVTGNQMRQSPINIITADVQVDDPFNLTLSGWNAGYDGSFNNTGITTQFTPSNIGGATTRNHLGTYELRNVHWHWGSRTGEGSEHRIDNAIAELEIHFVHFMRGATDTSARDYTSVIAVLADVVDEAISGPWEQLDASAVPECGNSTPITGFRFDSLLPNSLDYYYYEGSLTAPPCTEVVNWFVLKDRVNVPAAYLDQLRATEQADGTPLTFNFRDLQEIGDRTVYSQSSAITPTSSQMTPVSFLMIVTLLVFWA